MFDLTNARFAFLDTETTGLAPWFGDRICEVGIVVTEGRRVKGTYQQLLNPQRPISPAAASTNHLTDEMVAGEPLFERAAEEIWKRLDGAIVVCHNARFDLQFMDSEFHRLGRDIQLCNVIDTLLIARQYFDLPSYTLTNLAAEFSIQNPNAHRALADALTDKNLFFAMMDSIKPSNQQFSDMIGIYNSPAMPQEDIQLPTHFHEAIYSGKDLKLEYCDKNGKNSSREVTPLQVIQLQDYIYLRAHCHLRDKERTFRLDRIVSLRLS